MPSIGENTPEKKHQKIEFYLSKFPTRDHPKKYRFLWGGRTNFGCFSKTLRAHISKSTLKNVFIKIWGGGVPFQISFWGDLTIHLKFFIHTCNIDSSSYIIYFIRDHDTGKHKYGGQKRKRSIIVYNV